MHWHAPPKPPDIAAKLPKSARGIYHITRASAKGQGRLNVSGSKAALHRTLLLPEALIRACESRGWKVGSEKEATSAEVIIAEDPVSIRLSEKIERTEIPPKPEEKGRWSYKQYQYTALGRLSIEITDYLSTGMRKTWRDGKIQRLEDLLPEVVAGLEMASDDLRKRRLEAAEGERQWAEEERQRQELAGRVRTERERRIRLVAQATGLEKAAAIRRLCEQVELRISQEPVRFPKDQAERYLKWALVIANKHDPVENGYIDALLTALAYPMGGNGLKLQSVARVGSGFNDQDRVDWHGRLSALRVDAPLAMSDSDGRPVRFVKPGFVVELEAEDVLPADDEASGQQVFGWDQSRWSFEGLASSPRLLLPTYHRLRADKEFGPQSVRISQLIGREMAAPELINRTVPALEVVRREVYTKEVKGAVAVRKLVVGRRPATAGAFPYVVFWTDFSAGRKTPLEVTTLFAHTETRAEALVQKLIPRISPRASNARTDQSHRRPHPPPRNRRRNRNPKRRLQRRSLPPSDRWRNARGSTR